MAVKLTISEKSLKIVFNLNDINFLVWDLDGYLPLIAVISFYMGMYFIQRINGK